MTDLTLEMTYLSLEVTDLLPEMTFLSTRTAPVDPSNLFHIQQQMC